MYSRLINDYSRLKKAQHILRIYSQQQYTYIEQLQRSFFELTLVTQQSSFQREKSKINKVLEGLMMTSFCNQFILIVTNILEILSSLHPNNMYFAYFLRLWLSEAISKKDINDINKELNLIHDKCIKMASQFEPDEKNNEKSFGKNKKPKLAKKKLIPNDDNKQSIQQDQKHLAIRRKMNSQQSSKIFMKVYEVKHEIQKIYWVHKKFIKYIAIDRMDTNLIQYYRIQAKVIENQMKILRHLSSIKKNFVFKYKITLDRHPENEQDQKENPTLSPSLCFEFQSIKADKDYATRYNEQSRPSTTRQHLWAYLDKDIIYHFILCFATSIIQLEANYIHYLDFSYENFVKFHQIFELIDMQYAYVVDLNDLSFQQTNRELFQIWLQSSLNSTFSYLIHSSETHYQLIKKEYMEDRLSKQEAVNRCILLMYDNMKKDHYYQFHNLCHDLLSDQSEKFKGFPLSRDELYDIKREIPQNPINLEGFYKKFIKKLQVIYSRYNSKVNLINGYQHSVRNYLQTIPDPRIVNEMIRKRIFFTRSFQQLPLEYCYSHDEIFIKEQEVMIRSRKDHILISIGHLYQKQRYLIQFLLCCVLLLQELDKNGLILLNLDIQSFVRSGEAFFLKNFIYLFKVGPKFSEKDSQIRSDVQLHKISIQLLAKLSTERQNLRENDFDEDTLDNIYKIVVLDSKEEECQNMSHIQRINMFFKRNIRKIHFDQFKKLANALLDNAPQHFKSTDDLKGYVNAKNLANFYTLIEELRDMGIVSSF